MRFLADDLGGDPTLSRNVCAGPRLSVSSPAATSPAKRRCVTWCELPFTAAELLPLTEFWALNEQVLTLHSLNSPFFFFNETSCLAKPVGEISGCKSQDGVTSASTGLDSKAGAGGCCLASCSASWAPGRGSRVQVQHPTLRWNTPLSSCLPTPGLANVLFSLSCAQLKSWLCKSGGEFFSSLYSQARKYFWFCLRTDLL